MTPSVLIVDDHGAFRESARVLLEAEGLKVLGAVGSGEEALAEAERLSPDVVLLDVQLPGMDGFAVADALARLSPRPAVVLISSRDANSYGARVAEAPVRGFLAKHELSGAALVDLLS